MKITLQIEDVSYLNAEPILSFASALEDGFFLIEEFSNHMLYFLDTLDGMEIDKMGGRDLKLFNAYFDFGEAIRDIMYPNREKLPEG